MKTSKLLNSKYLSIIISVLLIGSGLCADEKPVDIWNIDKKENENSSQITSNTENSDINKDPETNIYSMQSQKKTNSIEMEQSLNSQDLKILGLYDPEDYNLKINMWSNSDGDQLKYLFSNLDTLTLSEDAAELMDILLLTNAYYPNKNITEQEFQNIKSKWLIKNKNFDLIEQYLMKNKVLDLHPKLSRFLVDHYLSNSNITKACDIFLKYNEQINDEYLSKFNLYCLVNEGKIEEAQLILDLKKELGFKDEYFEKKMNFLIGYTDKIDVSISEKNILDFHLAHRTNSNFFFEPKANTKKIIWKYLASSNLLYKVDEIEISDFNKILLIEKAVNDNNYSEQELFQLYKRFQFNINQLLNAEDAYKTLTNVEARALIFQKILLESETVEKLKLIKLLRDLFIKDNFSNAFDEQLRKLLESLDPEKIPPNYTTFYRQFSKNNLQDEKDIKFNNDILHQSKLINYFNGDFSKNKIEKDINNFLKRIKKNKKYLISKKDIMFIESLRSDGIEISKKFDDLYRLDENDMPTDIQIMIGNDETAATMLRIIQVIGPDELVALDDDTLFFIISALNQLNIDYIRNSILLKVLPLKV